MICFLSIPENQEIFVKTMKAVSPQTQIVFLRKV